MKRGWSRLAIVTLTPWLFGWGIYIWQNVSAEHYARLALNGASSSAEQARKYGDGSSYNLKNIDEAVDEAGRQSLAGATAHGNWTWGLEIALAVPVICVVALGLGLWVAKGFRQ